MATVATTITPQVLFQPFTGQGNLAQRQTPIPQGIVYVGGVQSIAALGAGNESYVVGSIALPESYIYQLISTSLSIQMESTETMTYQDIARLSWDDTFDLENNPVSYHPMYANTADMLVGTTKLNTKTWTPQNLPAGLIWSPSNEVLNVNWSVWDLTPTSVAASAILLAQFYFYPWSQRFAAEANQSVLSLPYGSARSA